MAGVERLRKIRKLEARTEGVAASVTRLEEARRQRALEAAVARLSDEDLRTLDRVMDRAVAAISEAGGDHEGSGAAPDLWELAADERDREALEHLAEILADLGLGKLGEL